MFLVHRWSLTNVNKPLLLLCKIRANWQTRLQLNSHPYVYVYSLHTYGTTFWKTTCTENLGRFWPEPVQILVKRHTEFVFSVQIRHRHRFCFQVCFVRFVFCTDYCIRQIFHYFNISKRQTFSTLSMKIILWDRFLTLTF